MATFGAMVLWGPPGCGDYTIAGPPEQTNLASNRSRPFSGVVTSGGSSIAQRRRDRGTLLFVDEIHRFNRAQQDSSPLLGMAPRARWGHHRERLRHWSQLRNDQPVPRRHRPKTTDHRSKAHHMSKSHPIRSWLGVPATAERFHSPVLLPQP
jgi:hypothetical protein